MALWAVLAPNSLNNHGGQKLTCVTTQRVLNNFIERKLFCGMYGLAVMLSILTQTTSKNIDKISSNTYIKTEKRSNNFKLLLKVVKVFETNTEICKRRFRKLFLKDLINR